MGNPNGKDYNEWIERVKSEGEIPLLEADNCSKSNGWASPPGDIFMVRGPQYLSNQAKVPASTEYLLQPLGFDWVKAPKKLRKVLNNPEHRIWRALDRVEIPEGGNKPFVWAFNLMFPSKENLSIIAYFVAVDPIPSGSIMDCFLKGDNAYKNSRLKLIANVVKGPWAVKKAVGEQAICVVGKALTCKYCVSERFIEVDIDIGSSMVAAAIMQLAYGYLATLTADVAFVIEGRTEPEFPERILGAFRFSDLKPSLAKPIEMSSDVEALHTSLRTRRWKSYTQGVSNHVHPSGPVNRSSSCTFLADEISDNDQSNEEDTK